MVLDSFQKYNYVNVHDQSKIDEEKEKQRKEREKYREEDKRIKEEKKLREAAKRPNVFVILFEYNENRIIGVMKIQKRDFLKKQKWKNHLLLHQKRKKRKIIKKKKKKVKHLYKYSYNMYCIESK